MTTNATLTAQEYVLAAMQELGVLAAGELPTASDTTDGLRALQWMLKGWSAKGLNRWRMVSTTIVIPAGSASVQIPQAIEDIVAVRFGSPVERPLFRYERGQYVDLPNKTSRGIPSIYYLDQQVPQATLYVWPVPNPDLTMTLDAVRRIADVVNPDDVLDVPQAWTETVYIALAARLANMLGATRTNPTGTSLIIQRAQALERAMFDADRPSSIFMGAGR